MSEENLKIADIIYAYIDGSITEGQLGELTRWLGAAAEHREVFERLIAAASYRDKEAIYRRFDEYYNFDRLRRAIRHQRRIEWRRIAAAAAVVILPLLVTFFLLEQRVDSVRQEYPGEMTLLPGKSMATLTLSDGSSKALNRENFTVVDGSKRIVSNRGGLVLYREGHEFCRGGSVQHDTGSPRGGVQRDFGRRDEGMVEFGKFNPFSRCILGGRTQDMGERGGIRRGGGRCRATFYHEHGED